MLSRGPPVAMFLNDNIVNLNDDIEFAHFVSVSSMMYYFFHLYMYRGFEYRSKIG